MSVKSSPELKAYFQTGDYPTEAQFGDLIDTMFSQDQAALDASSQAVETAEAVAEALDGITFNFLVRAKLASNTWTVLGTAKNVASVTKVAANRLRITFTNAFANTDYPVATGIGLPNLSGGTLALIRNVAYVEIQQLNGSGGSQTIPDGVYLFWG